MTRFALGFVLVFGLACGGDDPAEPTTIHIQAPDEGGEAPEPTNGEGELAVGEDACETDDDCVPAECCHAAACVAQANAPNCEDMMCTQECRYGTLDCGGRCLCHEGRCAARLSVPPSFPE
ncbi:MAG: hypothetical protein KF901_33440 [Myxococcales bacterium]|nr:hypothetical protein [Myxococcales bacterium]